VSDNAVPRGLTLEQAADRAPRAADMFRRHGDAAGVAEALLSLGAVLHSWDRLEEAARIARATVAEMRRAGVDLVHEAPILGNCGVVALSDLRPRRCASVARGGHRGRPRRRRPTPGCAGPRRRGMRRVGTGDDSRAAEAFTEALEICGALGFFEVLPDGALGLAAVAADAGDLDRAALLTRAALEGFARAGTEPVLPLRRIIETRLDPAHQTAPRAPAARGARGRAAHRARAHRDSTRLPPPRRRRRHGAKRAAVTVAPPWEDGARCRGRRSGVKDPGLATQGRVVAAAGPDVQVGVRAAEPNRP
jgi:hypothetical protein